MDSIQSFKTRAAWLSREISFRLANTWQEAKIERYKKNGYLPWSKGYYQYKWAYIVKVIQNPSIIEGFRQNNSLPDGFGWRLDERVVEYPWMISRLPDALTKGLTKVLDAGSTLNYSEMLSHPKLGSKKVTIVTLAPENQCYWRRGVSYHFGDLRNLPFRDAWFEEIVCLSTLEHVGMNNASYGDHDETEIDEHGFVTAARELSRVLTCRGKLLISVPFGLPQKVVWDNRVFMRQFDSALLELLKSCFTDCSVSIVFYKYHEKGWNISSEQECTDAKYFNIHASRGYDSDLAAAARAIACLEITKLPTQ